MNHLYQTRSSILDRRATQAPNTVNPHAARSHAVNPHAARSHAVNPFDRDRQDIDRGALFVSPGVRDYIEGQATPPIITLAEADIEPLTIRDRISLAIQSWFPKK